MISRRRRFAFSGMSAGVGAPSKRENTSDVKQKNGDWLRTRCESAGESGGREVPVPILLRRHCNIRRQACGFALGTLAAAVLVAPAGCTLWSKPSPESVTVSSTNSVAPPTNFPSVGPQKAGKDELPSKQTARLCAATAEDMQKKGFTEQAIFLYEKAHENDPKLPNVAHHLALLYDQQGDGARALNEFKRALETAPKDADLLNDFGYYHYHHGNMADAETWYRKALAFSPNHAQALTNLAIVLGHQRRYQESIEKFTRVVGPAAAYSNVGVLMMEQGDRSQAHDAFMQAQRLDPTLKQPQAFLAYLDHAEHGKYAASPASSARRQRPALGRDGGTSDTGCSDRVAIIPAWRGGPATLVTSADSFRRGRRSRSRGRPVAKSGPQRFGTSLERRANFLMVRRCGRHSLPSRFAIADWLTPAASASPSCVRPLSRMIEVSRSENICSS